MKTVMLYRPNTEHARVTEEYVRDFERIKGEKIQLIDADTPEGASLVQLYDLPVQPTLIVIRDDGQLMTHWKGETFPLMSEVAAYLAA